MVEEIRETELVPSAQVSNHGQGVRFGCHIKGK